MYMYMYMYVYIYIYMYTYIFPQKGFAQKGHKSDILP